jgi:hypothetical protein
MQFVKFALLKTEEQTAEFSNLLIGWNMIIVWGLIADFICGIVSHSS